MGELEHLVEIETEGKSHEYPYILQLDRVFMKYFKKFFVEKQCVNTLLTTIKGADVWVAVHTITALLGTGLPKQKRS